jgi:hypothetical protein
MVCYDKIHEYSFLSDQLKNAVRRIKHANVVHWECYVGSLYTTGLFYFTKISEMENITSYIPFSVFFVA